MIRDQDRLLVLLQEHKIICDEIQTRTKLGMTVLQLYLVLIGGIYAALIVADRLYFLPLSAFIGAGFAALMSTQTYHLGLLHRYLLTIEYKKIPDLLGWQEYFLKSTAKRRYKYHKYFSGALIIGATSMLPSVIICILAILYSRILGVLRPLGLSDNSLIIWWTDCLWKRITCGGIIVIVIVGVCLIYWTQSFISPKNILKEVESCLSKSEPQTPTSQ